MVRRSQVRWWAGIISFGWWVVNVQEISLEAKRQKMDLEEVHGIWRKSPHMISTTDLLADLSSLEVPVRMVVPQTLYSRKGGTHAA